MLVTALSTLSTLLPVSLVRKSEAVLRQIRCPLWLSYMSTISVPAGAYATLAGASPGASTPTAFQARLLRPE